MYVLECDGRSAGQIRFEIEKGEAEIGFSIDQNHRGRGLGTEILKLGTLRFFGDYPTIEKVHGFVKATNKPSIKAFQAAGFHEKGKDYPHGEKSLKFICQRMMK